MPDFFQHRRRQEQQPRVATRTTSAAIAAPPECHLNGEDQAAFVGRIADWRQELCEGSGVYLKLRYNDEPIRVVVKRIERRHGCDYDFSNPGNNDRVNRAAGSILHVSFIILFFRKESID